MIVIEIRKLRREKIKRYTGSMLSRFYQQAPFQYRKYDQETLRSFLEDFDLTSEQETKRQALIEHLNMLEFISTLINDGSLDESIYKNYSKGEFIKAFKELRVFILNVRDATKNPSVYEQLERVARRWERNNDF